MGRGRPFVQPLSRLVKGGVAPRPAWMTAVEATPPLFEPVVQTKPPRLVYPEDRLRNIFLQRNPETRRLPVNLKARSIPERHIADRFAAIQQQLMHDEGLAEDDAYAAADRILNAAVLESNRISDDLNGPLSNPAVKDDASRLFLASLKDSQRDQALHSALLQRADSK